MEMNLLLNLIFFNLHNLYKLYTWLFYTLKTHFTFYTDFSSQKVKIIKPDLFRGSQKTTAEETAKCVKTSPQKIQVGVTQYFLVSAKLVRTVKPLCLCTGDRESYANLM